MNVLYLTGYELIYKKYEDHANSYFLGPWCFGNNSVFKFEDQRQYNIIPSPYQSWNEILLISAKLNKLTDRVISRLRVILNEHLQETLSEQFWRRFYVNRVSQLVGIFYDRYIHLLGLKDCNLKIPILEIKNLESFELHDIFIFHTSHSANLFLYSHMIQTIGDFKSYEISKEELEISPIEEFQYKKEARQKLTLNTIKEKLELYVNDKSPLYLGNIYGMNLIDKLSIQRQSIGFISLLKNLYQNVFSWADFSRGQQRLASRNGIGLDMENQFEEWVDKYILNFLEIPSKVEISKELKDIPKIWIGADYTKHPLKLALLSEANGKWFAVQHGGGYGQFFSFPLGKVEYENSDAFLSWGWTYNHIYCTDNIEYLPSPLLSKIQNTDNKKANRNILLISTQHPIYLYRHHSAILPKEQLDYIETRINFLGELSPNAMEDLFYRPYPVDYGQQDSSIFHKMKLKFDTDAYLIKENLYKKYRLVVVDHLATSYLHTFVMNIPTLIFFRREHFEYCKEAEPYFQKLIEAEILFHDEALAAKKVNEIYSNPTKWWNSENVQKAKNEFCFMYARPSLDWKKDWVQYIQAKLNEATN